MMMRGSHPLLPDSEIIQQLLSKIRSLRHVFASRLENESSPQESQTEGGELWRRMPA
ncbi:unnamed protein product, partial [Linum tenue]